MSFTIRKGPQIHEIDTFDTQIAKTDVALIPHFAVCSLTFAFSPSPNPPSTSPCVTARNAACSPDEDRPPIPGNKRSTAPSRLYGHEE